MCELGSRPVGDLKTGLALSSSREHQYQPSVEWLGAELLGKGDGEAHWGTTATACAAQRERSEDEGENRYNQGVGGKPLASGHDETSSLLRGGSGVTGYRVAGPEARHESMAAIQTYTRFDLASTPVVPVESRARLLAPRARTAELSGPSHRIVGSEDRRRRVRASVSKRLPQARSELSV